MPEIRHRINKDNHPEGKHSLFLAAAAVALLIMVLLFALIIEPGEEGLDDSLPVSSPLYPDRPALVDDIVIDEVAETRAVQTVEETDDLDAPRFGSRSSPGWYIWGKVTDTEGKPLADAKVLLTFRFKSHYPYPPVYTDDSGIYRADILAPEEVMVLPPRDFIPLTIDGLARAAGHQNREGKLHKFPHPKKFSKPLRLDFELEPGVFLRGRVVMEDGSPAPNVGVALWKPDQKERRSGGTYRDGCYAIPIIEPGTFELRAVRMGTGYSPSIMVELDPARDYLADDLVLHTFSTLEGVVVDPDGHPIGGQGVTAYPEEILDSTIPEMTFSNMNARKKAMSGEAEKEGLSQGFTTTDRKGCFRIAGLKKGRYFLRTTFHWMHFVKWCREHHEAFGLDRNEEDPPAYEDPFDRILYETGKKGIRIVLPIHRLKVTLRDEDGNLIPEGELALMPGDRISRNVLGGISLMEVEPGPLQLTAHTWYGLYAQEEIVIHENNYFTEIDLTLKKGVPPEEALFVLFTDSHGRTVTDFERMLIDLRGRLHKLSSKKFNITGLKKNEHGEFVLSVLPDTYWLIAEPGGGGNFFMEPARKEIIVRPGQENRVTIPLIMGGRIALRLQWSGAWKDQGIRLWKRDETGIYNDTSRHILCFKSGTDWLVWYKDLEPDVEYEYTELLEPGIYKVGLQSGEGPARTVEFTIEPGKITPVKLWL